MAASGSIPRPRLSQGRLNVDREKQFARAMDGKALHSEVVRHPRRNAGDSIVLPKRPCHVVPKVDGPSSPFRLHVEAVARLAALGELLVFRSRRRNASGEAV